MVDDGEGGLSGAACIDQTPVLLQIAQATEKLCAMLFGENLISRS